jgi:hypothetical protein
MASMAILLANRFQSRRRMPKAVKPAAVALGLLLAADTGHTQGTTLLEFSFSNPGARAMGFGGAFIGLADDATAAYANPAGLVQLVEPEISLETRAWTHDTPFTAGGRAAGQPSGLGIDTLPGLAQGVSSEEARGLSFLSWVQPLGRWSLALYRHQLARFESRFVTNGLFAGPASAAALRLPDAVSSTRLDNISLGLSAAYEVSDTFSVGLGVARVEGEIDIREETFLPDDDTIGARFGPATYSPARSVGSTQLLAEDTDWVLLAGLLWRLSDKLSLGGVYRQGPTAEAEAIATAGPAFSPYVPAGATQRFRTTLKAPDVLGLGLAVRLPGDALTLSVDWVRVEYSDLLEGRDPEVFDDPFVIADGDELHAGLEYVLLEATPLVALRAGAWLDPDHRLAVDPARADTFERALFPGGDDELHLAAGLGLAFPTFQIDLAVDFSELADTAAVSVIWQF